MISIYRNITKVADVEPMTSTNYTESLMAEHQVTLVFEQSSFLELLIGDHITFEGVKYTLNKLPTVKKISTRLYQYNAVFQHPRYDLLKAIYMLFDNTATPAQGEFSLTGTAGTFVDLLVANMNRVSSGWTKGTVPDSEHKTLTFTNENCHAVLERLAQEFDTEFHVINKTFYLDKIATSRELTLQYGSTAYDIERVSVNSQDVVTRLYAFGSDKNISSQYRNGSGRLLIPAPNSYIESNVSAYGVIEQAKTFEDIYPRLSLLGAGVVSAVGDKYTFSDSAIDFDVNACLMPGVPAKIRFLTGECAGYDFEIRSYNNSTKTFVIIENSKDEDLVLPTDLLKPAVGDKYVLLDVVMPQAYVEAAEAELLSKAQQYLADNNTAKVDYRVRFSAIYAKQNLPVIQCCDQVHVYDADLGIDEQIRIVKLQKGIRDAYNIQIELSNTVSRSTLQRIAGELREINNQVVVSNQANKQRGIEAYQRTRELQQMVFDPDGYFDTDNIRPLSIETGMLSVGAKSQQYQLSNLLQPNYNGNPQSMYWSAGLLTHFSLVDDQIKEWAIASGNITITGDNQTRALYIYARCSRSGSTGDIYLSENAFKFDSDTTYWYFLVGILHTPVSDVRGISQSYGQTTINGQFIRTGVISSVDGSTYFNLNTGEIGGNIKFKAGSTYTDVGAGIAGAIATAAADATAKANAAQAAAESLANEAWDYADEANANAMNAIDSANTANTLLSNIANDNKLTSDEKQSTKKEWDIIVAEYTPILNQGTAFGITTEKTAFTTKYNALSDYLAPLLSNLTTTSDITGSVFRSTFAEYYTAKVNLLNAISAKAKQLADNAQADADQAWAYADDVQNELNGLQVGGENIADRTEIAIVAGAENSKFEFIKGNLSSTPVSGSYLKNNQAHVLTLSESIRTAGTATHYSVVLFDFTQLINTYQQEFTFSTAKRVIKFTTPATGNWSLLIYAGIAGATAGNSVEYKGIMLQEGNRETAYQSAVKYLTQAIEGSTEISGGLVATNIMLLKNALNEITGGLSGIDDDNIGFWTGGTYADALANIAKIILRKDGSGQLAGGSLSWDLLGQLLFGKVGDSETIKISTGAIPDLAEINNREEYSLPILNENVVKNLNNPADAGINVNTAYNQEFTLENDAYLTIDAAVQYTAGSDIIGFGIDGMVWLEKFNGTSWVSVQQGTVDQLLISLSIYQLSVTKGRFRVRWDVVCGYTDVQGPSATISLNKFCGIDYKLNVKKLVIGIDGIALFDSMSDKYLRLSLKDNVAQLRMKLDTDMPGVLASGSVTSGGGNQNPWGAKKSTNNASYTATGIYDVPHNAGSIYQVQVTPTADNIECKVVSKSNNTFRVQVRSNSGTATTGSFDYVIFGKN